MTPVYNQCCYIYNSVFFYITVETSTFALADPLSHSMGTGVQGHFPGVKRPEREIEHSAPSNAKVKKKWSYTPLAFMV
jgi:hypothetical protein